MTTPELSVDRLLLKLECKLSQSPSTLLECNKISFNIEYARKLLLQWECKEDHSSKEGEIIERRRRKVRELNERLHLYEENIPAPDILDETVPKPQARRESLGDEGLRNRKTHAPHEDAIAQHGAAQEAMSVDLLRMSSILRSNAVTFNEKLEKDASTIDGTGKMLQRNADTMKKTGGKLGQYSKQTGSTFWLLIGITAVSLLLFGFVLAIIAIT